MPRDFDEDWVHHTPTKQQVEDWLRERSRENPQLSAGDLSLRAYEHFHQPFQLIELREMAMRIVAEPRDTKG